MLRTILGVGLLASCSVFAQTAEDLTSFEVASVKPAEPQTGNMFRVMMKGGPESNDPGQITYTNVSLKNVMTIAYGIKSYQIHGPSWLDSERFDIIAKIPKGASKEQFKLMLQKLLTERFKMQIHHDKKELPMYALVVGKNGPKMKESPEDPPATGNDVKTDGGPSSGPPPPPPPPPGAGVGVAGPRMTMGRDGFPQMPAGARKGTMMMFGGGRFKMQANQQTMSGFTEMLANQLGSPVVDMTGLKAKYDFELEFAPDENMRGPMGGMPHPPVSGDGPGGGPPPLPEGGTGPSIFSALQDQLGLKLDARKGPVDIIVIDRMEKVPTEN